MKHRTDQKNIFAIVMFLVAFAGGSRAYGRTCSDLFLNNLLPSSEIASAHLDRKVDRASLAVAWALTESVTSRTEDSFAFTRMVQNHIVRTFEVNLQLMFEQRRDLYDFLVDPNSPLTPNHIGELLGATSRVYSVKVKGGEIFQVASQDKNVFFEVANRLKLNRGVLR